MPKHGNTRTHARTHAHTRTQTLVQRERKINNINLDTERIPNV